MNYKADTTLNERDSLQDLLNLEKQALKCYSTAITEGVSKGFRTQIKTNLKESIEDQINVFFLMTEHGYAQVESAPKEQKNALKEKFSKVKNQLS